MPTYPLTQPKTIGQAGHTAGHNEERVAINDLNDRAVALAARAAVLEGRALVATGSPQGVISAGVGTKYIDTNATYGAVEWVKATSGVEVGDSSLGWRVVYGDTGWRAITTHTSGGAISGAAYPAGMSPQGGVAGGLYLRRVGARAMWRIVGVALSAGVTQVDLPAGFRGQVLGSGQQSVLTGFTGSDLIGVRRPSTVLYLNPIGGSVGAYEVGDDYLAEDGWATALPGAAA